jgi:F0F1-type ATP synthase membrane subunit b/b'
MEQQKADIVQTISMYLDGIELMREAISLAIPIKERSVVAELNRKIERNLKSAEGRVVELTSRLDEQKRQSTPKQPQNTQKFNSKPLVQAKPQLVRQRSVFVSELGSDVADTAQTHNPWTAIKRFIQTTAKETRIAAR